MPNKKKRSGRRRGNTMFPAAGETCPRSDLPVAMKAPQLAPEINTSPSFRRVVRFVNNTIASGAVFTMTTNQIFSRDSSDYGLSAARWQGIQVVAARVYASAGAIGQPQISVGVNSLSPSSQSSAFFNGMGNVSQNAVVAFRWPRVVQMTNIPSGTDTTLFGVTNAGAVSVTLMVDMDVVFTG